MNRIKSLMTRFALLLMISLSIFGERRAGAQEEVHIDRTLVFLSTFDDVEDVNLFGPDQDSGWIYTGDSPTLDRTWVQNRIESTYIQDDEGLFRDCLRFTKRSERVLYYEAAASLNGAAADWVGTISLWIKPATPEMGSTPCYPFQLTDGDWRHGGFYVRFPRANLTNFEFGAVEAHATEGGEPVAIDDVEDRFNTYVKIEDAPFRDDEWTLLTLTLDRLNPSDDGLSTVRLYVNGTMQGEIRMPLTIDWLRPDAKLESREGVIILGADYIGDMDDLRMYGRSLNVATIEALHRRGEVVEQE